METDGALSTSDTINVDQSASNPKIISIIVHGGAYAIPDHLRTQATEGCDAASTIGYAVLAKGGTAIEAVEAAVNSLENNIYFNAGTGALLNRDGEIELDAMIMSGDLRTGAVAAIQGVKNPISVARMVMDSSNHCLLVGDGAKKFAQGKGVAMVETKDLTAPGAFEEWQKYKESGNFSQNVVDFFGCTDHDTVGAVAFDSNGNLACATSTGGITMKQPGRVGDSPLVGSGGYADNEMGACSATGHGESLLKVAASLRALMRLDKNTTPSEAAKLTLNEMWTRIGGRGGLIMINNRGDVGHYATTERMVYASKHGVVGKEIPTTVDAGIENAIVFNELK
eukprot:m.263471 g.263471  ORF g.263471 m.263471 type:complete len:339 (-) comp50556_c0_seq1:266-1282(-)